MKRAILEFPLLDSFYRVGHGQLPYKKEFMHLVINEKMSNLVIVDFIGSQQPIFELLYIVEGTLDS